MNRPARVAIALGSNLGDRERHLDFAVDRLSRLLLEPLFSHRYETVPQDVPSDQPRYLNAAAAGRYDGSPLALLAQLQAVEAACGRERPYPNAPRTLDLDLILFGVEVVDDPRLTLPHPRFRDRRFVLEPLAEIAPGMVDPVTGMTVAGLLDRLRQRR